ncbi:hypothetical protein MA9V1_061 [Chryseobacterium phage MA9V-1]|nr:hypothetical protein MA9V1_061 [Chryseobacterium phage MA9V-1]
MPTDYSQPASTLWLMQDHIDRNTTGYVDRKELLRLVKQINKRNVADSTIDGYRRMLTIIGVLSEPVSPGSYKVLIKHAYRFSSSDLKTYAADVIHKRNTDIWPVRAKRFNPIKFVTDNNGNTVRLDPKSHMTTKQKELFDKNFK